MIPTRETRPSRAFVIQAEEVVAREAHVASAAESLRRCAEHVHEQLDRGSTPNSLGEVQNKGAMLDAAIGRLTAARDALEIMASTVMADGTLILDADDVTWLENLIGQSKWLERNVAPFMVKS